MSESKIMRLVRCPKCQNLLPELADYSVYQCGGCGAVLRAKLKHQEKEVLTEKCDEGKISVTANSGSGKRMQEMSESLPENDVSVMDTEANCTAFSSIENNGVKMDKYLKSQNGQIYGLVDRADPDKSIHRCELGTVEELPNYFGNISRYQGSEPVPSRQGEMPGQCGDVRGGNQHRRPLNSSHQDEGPSNYFSESSDGNNAEDGKGNCGLLRPTRIDSLQQDRAELLQMMEELRDQLRRSGDLGVNLKDKGPIDPYAAHQRPNISSTSGLFSNNNVAAPSAGIHQDFMPNKPTDSPYYHPLHPPRYPHDSRQRMGVSNPHPFPYGLTDMPGSRNYFELQTMRGPFPTLNRYEHQLLHPPYYPGQSFAADPTIYDPNLNNRLSHHPVCGCYSCCSDHHRANQPEYPADTRFVDINSNTVLYPQNIPGPSAQRGYSLQTSGPSQCVDCPSVRARFADDMACHTRGFVRRHQQKEALAKGRLHCQPIASGAPFLVCRSCSELLQLPKMTFKLKSKRQKICCGACNTVMDCSFTNKKFIISVSSESKKIVKGVGTCLDDMLHEGISSELWAKTSSISDDSDSSSHEFQEVTGKAPVITRGLDLTSNETHDSQSLPPSSPANFEGVESSDGLASPSLQGLPMPDQLGHSFNANVTSRVWMGSQSARSDHEKLMPKDTISRQNSLNETSSTAQMEEVSFTVYSKTQVSQKSELATQKSDPVKTNKGSGFASVIKKSIKGLSRSNHSADNRDGNVTINGCKIPDRLVKKAEKLAGPIQPGNYWYDFRAGFWGVIAGPCLGIIPQIVRAAIQEFL
uniref:Zinc-ribbon domain-containing protein n=1 Tax=Kalanchoe fedtschenkoi TaxID=63787 RepID=A0A7N0UFU1_KALFE